jgi:hypothetical protein
LAIGAAPLTAWRTRPPKTARTFLKSSSSAASKGCEQVGRDLLAADLQVADLHAQLAAACISPGPRAAGRRARGVDLLEDARHARQVGRLDLLQLGTIWVRVAAEVGDGGADVEVDELDEQRVGVRQREEEVGDLLLLHGAADSSIVTTRR